MLALSVRNPACASRPSAGSRPRAAKVTLASTSVAVMALCMAVAMGCAPSNANPGLSNENNARPNIVLIMADDQGFGDVGYNGHPVLKTPNLDAMAASGLRFDRFYAAASVCSPTRGSVLTGRNPNRFGCFSWGHTLRPQEITLAELLRDSGYATGHFGKWHLGSIRRGSRVNPGASGFDRWLSAENFYDNDPILSREGEAIQLKGESSMVAAEAAIDFMKEASHDGKPFLAVVWFGSPHNPHEAAEEDRLLYAEHGEKADFYGEISGLDRAVGRLRHALREMNAHQNTIVWYCSDNGALPRLGEPGGRGHKGDLYEGGLRVPAIVEWPAVITQPRAIPLPATTSDIFPTVLEVVGILPPRDRAIDGESLLPVLHGKNIEKRSPIGFWTYSEKGVPTPHKVWAQELFDAQQRGQEPRNPSRLRPDAGVIRQQAHTGSPQGHAAWLDWPWKLHRITDATSSKPRYELYNLAVDPAEQDDLTGKEASKAQSMRASLEAWQQSVLASLNGAEYDSLPELSEP